MQTKIKNTAANATVSTTTEPVGIFSPGTLFRVIPAPWDDSAQPQDFPGVPYPVPEGTTFFDGVLITAFRVHIALVIAEDVRPEGISKDVQPRIYGFRLKDWLIICAAEGEDATAAATLAMAQVDPGIPLVRGERRNAVYSGNASQGKPSVSLTDEQYDAALAEWKGRTGK